MREQVTVRAERVDDLPILLAQSDTMGRAAQVDECFKPHGNGERLSLGWTPTVWLAHIMSERDHRRNQVQGRAAHQVQPLSLCTGQEVIERGLSDDRLALVLDALSDEQKWQDFETALTRRLIRVSGLKPKRVRVDSTAASGYGTVSEEGLFQGGRKDHRPDLPQLKVTLSALDPLGLPLVTRVVAGQAADDPLSIPAIKQVSQRLPEHGVLSMGDGKMAALSTRAYLQAQGDYELCPLAQTQLPAQKLDRSRQSVWSGEQPVGAVHRAKTEEQDEVIAQRFEQTVVCSSEVAGQALNWKRICSILPPLQR